MKVHIIILSVASLLLAKGGAAHAVKTQECPPAKPAGPESVVKTIYENYPWTGSKVIKNEPKNVLFRYFDVDLTDLIIRNQECEKGGDLCYINFDILFYAQDADIKNLHVCEMPPQINIVDVGYLNFGRAETIHYKLSSTANGWRISDIVYSDGISLKDYLSNELK